MQRSPLSKVAALIIVSIIFAWLLSRYDALALRRISTLSPAEYVDYQRHLHQHGYFFHLFMCLVLGGAYLGAIKVLTGVTSLLLPKRQVSDAVVE